MKYQNVLADKLKDKKVKSEILVAITCREARREGRHTANTVTSTIIFNFLIFISILMIFI
jgi:hypothetical protein